MGIQQFTDVGPRHDDTLVDMEGQPAHVDLVDQISGRLPCRDAPRHHLEDGIGLPFRDPRRREALELVGMQMQGFADKEHGLGDGIAGAVREYQLRLDKTAGQIADEIEQRPQFAGVAIRSGGFPRASGRPLGACCHQPLVQRAAAASS